MLKSELGYQAVDVVSYFEMYEEYMDENDRKLVWETDLTELLSERTEYDMIIGDPLYFSLLPYKPEQLISLPHIAVSSRAFWNKSANLFGEKGSLYFEQILAK